MSSCALRYIVPLSTMLGPRSQCPRLFLSTDLILIDCSSRQRGRHWPLPGPSPPFTLLAPAIHPRNGRNPSLPNNASPDSVNAAKRQTRPRQKLRRNVSEASVMRRRRIASSPGRESSTIAGRPRGSAHLHAADVNCGRAPHTERSSAHAKTAPRREPRREPRKTGSPRGEGGHFRRGTYASSRAGQRSRVVEPATRTGSSRSASMKNSRRRTQISERHTPLGR